MNIQGIISSINIFVCYTLLIIALPAFMLKPRLGDESIIKRFLIYMVFGNIYISSLVFVLAYLNVFNRPILIITTVCLSIFIRFLLNKDGCTGTLVSIKIASENLILGKYGFRLLVRNLYEKIIRGIKTLFYELFHEKKIEWILFLMILAYNTYQYGTNAMRFSTYLAPDEEVHLYWIQSLIKGEIYPSGVYPHVFHNILAALMVIFNINAMKMIQFFSLTSSIIIMITLYIGLRKIFISKYPALFGFMVFSLADLYIVHATSRYQFSIPQEYAMIMLMPMAIFLFSYIKGKRFKDLIFFALSLSLSFSIHFYTGIIAIILMGSIGLVYIYKNIKDKILVKLILASILSAIVALSPLATGLALGHEMEQSMSWAVEVIKGDVYEADSEEVEEMDDMDDMDEEDQPLTWASMKRAVKEDLIKYGVTDIRIVYYFLVVILATIIFNLFLIFKKKLDEKSLHKIAFGVNSLILLLLMISKALGLPTIMEPKRVMIFVAYFSPLWIGMPLEFIIRLIKEQADIKKQKLIPLIFTLVTSVSLVVIIKYNHLRPLPVIYYFQTSGTMKSNMSIISDYDDYTWTVVSPVNNISAVLNNGYHYELSDFMILQEDWNKDKEIRIPTQYVFIYIEKRPIVDYGFDFKRDDPQVIARKFIKREDSLKELEVDKEDNYNYKRQRNVLMAKAYYWAQEYQRYFPKEMNVYYEDNELIVYRIKQNPYALNNFNIDYKLNRK